MEVLYFSFRIQGNENIACFKGLSCWSPTDITKWNIWSRRGESLCQSSVSCVENFNLTVFASCFENKGFQVYYVSNKDANNVLGGDIHLK